MQYRFAALSEGRAFALREQLRPKARQWQTLQWFPVPRSPPWPSRRPSPPRRGRPAKRTAQRRCPPGRERQRTGQAGSQQPGRSISPSRQPEWHLRTCLPRKERRPRSGWRRGNRAAARVQARGAGLSREGPGVGGGSASSSRGQLDWLLACLPASPLNSRRPPPASSADLFGSRLISLPRLPHQL